MLDYFPKYFSNKAIMLYIVLLFSVSIIFLDYVLPFIYIFFGIIQVIGFFYFSNFLTKKWGNLSPNQFAKNLFFTALTIRLIWVVASYFLFIYWTGIPFEWASKDALGYHESARWLRILLIEGDSGPYFQQFDGQVSDAGFATYLGYFYYIFGESVFLVRLTKAIYGAFTVYLVYKLATRTFGDSTGKMAGIFAMLMPNLIYYAGTHLKEVEMLLLTVWFLERADVLLRGQKFTFNTLWLPLLLAISLFFFRTVLGVTAIFGLFTALFLSSGRSVKLAKRLIGTIWFSIALVYFVGSRYFIEVDYLWNQKQSSQSVSMEWRSEREGGNKFAKYASTAVFAPLIFIIPLSSMVYVENQDVQMFFNGGNFVKNILAFFLIFALYNMIKEKKWRDYLLIVSFVIGYLAVIAMSEFAQSERFHQPIIPLYLILVAYGINNISNQQKKYFSIYIVIIFAITIAWGWFKLSGRGLI